MFGFLPAGDIKDEEAEDFDDGKKRMNYRQFQTILAAAAAHNTEQQQAEVGKNIRRLAEYRTDWLEQAIKEIIEAEQKGNRNSNQVWKQRQTIIEKGATAKSPWKNLTYTHMHVTTLVTEAEENRDDEQDELQGGRRRRRDREEDY